MARASADDITMADLRKKLKSVKREARKVSQETKKHDRMVREKMDQIETIAVDLEKASAEYSKLEDDANEKQRRVNNIRKAAQNGSSPEAAKAA